MGFGSLPGTKRRLMWKMNSPCTDMLLFLLLIFSIFSQNAASYCHLWTLPRNPACYPHLPPPSPSSQSFVITRFRLELISIVWIICELYLPLHRWRETDFYWLWPDDQTLWMNLRLCLWSPAVNCWSCFSHPCKLSNVLIKWLLWPICTVEKWQQSGSEVISLACTAHI